MDYKLTDEEIMKLTGISSVEKVDGTIDERRQLELKRLRAIADAQLSKLLKPYEGLAERIKEIAIKTVCHACPYSCNSGEVDICPDIQNYKKDFLSLIAAECLQARKELIDWIAFTFSDDITRAQMMATGTWQKKLNEWGIDNP